MSEQKIPINPNTPLTPGDVFEIHFWAPTRPLLQAVQLAYIEKRIRDKYGYELTRWQFDENRLIIRVDTSFPTDQPRRYEAGVTPADVAIAIAGVLGILFVWLTAREFYKVVQTPAGAITTAGIGVAAILLLLVLLRRK